MSTSSGSGSRFTTYGLGVDGVSVAVGSGDAVEVLELVSVTVAAGVGDWLWRGIIGVGCGTLEG